MTNTLQPGQSIFIAEDDQDDFALFEEMLHELTPETRLVWARNGDELLNELANPINQGVPALIILDYNMPRLNGMETLDLLNAHMQYSAIPKVMYTGATYQEYREEGLKKGLNGYVLKGHTLNDIRQNVQDMLDIIG